MYIFWTPGFGCGRYFASRADRDRDDRCSDEIRQVARRAGSGVRCGDVRERRLAKFRQNVARFRLYRLRFLQENMRFAAFFKIYQILKLKFLKFDKILQTSRPRRRGLSRGGGLSNAFIVDS